MLVVGQLVRNLVKSMVNFFSESDYSSKFLSVLGTPKYSVTLYYEFMSFHVKINRNDFVHYKAIWKNKKFSHLKKFRETNLQGRMLDVLISRNAIFAKYVIFP